MHCVVFVFIVLYRCTLCGLCCKCISCVVIVCTMFFVQQSVDTLDTVCSHDGETYSSDDVCCIVINAMCCDVCSNHATQWAQCVVTTERCTAVMVCAAL